MENASQALLIAGAILIVIALIGFGVYIIGRADSIKNAGGDAMDTYAIETFNSKFLEYEGTDISASQARKLISTINASNGANEKDITIYNDTDFGEGDNVAPTITAGQTYTVKVNYGNDGYIDKIAIKQN